MLEVTYYKECQYDEDLGCRPIIELFRNVSSSGFVPRVGDFVRHKEQTWPVIRFAYYPARVGRKRDDSGELSSAYHPERASVVLGNPE